MAVKRFVRRSTSLKTWVGQSSPVIGSDVTAGSGGFSPGLKAFGGAGSEDATILRTRGAVGAWANNTALDGLQLAVGFGLCTTEAAAAGAVPLPFDNPEWDGWFVYMVLPFMPIGATAVTDSFVSMVIDSKAMRKIPSGQVLFLSTQVATANGAGGDTVIQSIQFRSLLKTS